MAVELEERRNIVAVYRYAGFEVVRTEPKGFFQRRPDGKGGYINNLDGVNPSLYRQDELRKAIDNHDVIYVVEGEKDVDRLRSEGLTATCNPMGAGKWRDSYSQALIGADVVIIPDNDQPGRDHAAEVARSCYGKATRICVLGLPDGKDVSEWLDNGHTAAELKELASRCPSYEQPTIDTPLKVTTHTVFDLGFALSDMGNAERFAFRRGGLRYCHARNKWLSWEGTHWQWQEDDALIERLAQYTVRDIYKEAQDCFDSDRRIELAKHAIKSEALPRIKAIIDLAKSQLGIPINLSELDTNPWLLNFKNGTVDLKAGEFREHRAFDFITHLLPYDFSADLERPLWQSFLDRATSGDKNLQTYIQRAVGYSLTGSNTAQIFFFLHGLGCNGKTTFLQTLRKAMGSYAARCAMDAFLLHDKSGSSHKESLANLAGKRFVTASEVEDNKALATSLIKDITGGESIVADRKYEHQFEYTPTFKLWLAGNHKPVIKDTTLSIWRRVKLIPFASTIPPEEIDEELPSKLEGEYPAIMAWAVEGCLDWQTQGFGEPAAVTDATATYRAESDILGEFIGDCCVLEPGATISKSALKEAYDAWCEENKQDPVTQRTFARRLQEKDIRDSRVNKSRLWTGIRLKNEAEE